jgi:uncharacterized small protein (DUF1192 family)
VVLGHAAMLAQPGLPGKVAALHLGGWNEEQDEMDEEKRKPPVSHEIGMGLDALSVAELEERIGVLESEIERLRAAIAAKGDSRKAAEAAFKF